MRWERVEELAGRAPSFADLRFHRLELVAARRLRERGEPLSPQLRDAERDRVLIDLAAHDVLRRIRRAYPGRLVLFKGPEAAARYPAAALRPYCDLDLLADDAAAAHRALLDAGFAPTGMWAPHVDLHHLQPLRWPGLPLGVEVHSRPHFPDGLRAPSVSELLDSTVPARFSDGIVDAPDPATHALLAATHAWAHAPLGHIGQLVDVALLALEVEPERLDALARRWGCRRLWRITQMAIDALFHDAPMPAIARLCAPHLQTVRERTVAERHIEEVVSPLLGLPAGRGAMQSARALARRVRRGDEETWPHKLMRTRRALRHARLRRSEHEARLPPDDRQIGGFKGLQPSPVPEREVRT
ncbi:MAG TPA: nucleotidyltransferase family protein [Solirubrobacteraceae bacterium]|nr:nucleotidyltransferase family protein [Solirubrobacteraceae bacterium]